MYIFLWIVFGALVGWVASLLMHSRRRGLIRNIIVGLLGSVIGGFFASLLGFGTINVFSLEAFALSVAGAVLLIWALRRL